MKLIAVEVGRSTQPFVLDEIRSLSGGYFPEGARLVSERYGFAGLPSFADATKGGAKFSAGRLIAGNRKVNIADLTIFSNGIQVTAASTGDADFVVDDILAWGTEALGYRQMKTKIPRIYESHMIVEFQRSPDRILRPFQKLQKNFEAALESTYGLKVSSSLAALGFGVDPSQVLAQLPPPFPPGTLRLELGLVPRLNHPYSDNRFFSTAPLRTEVHLALLEDFEAAIP